LLYAKVSQLLAEFACVHCRLLDCCCFVLFCFFALAVAWFLISLHLLCADELLILVKKILHQENFSWNILCILFKYLLLDLFTTDVPTRKKEIVSFNFIDNLEPLQKKIQQK